jgi:colicin import membrane protein
VNPSVYEVFEARDRWSALALTVVMHGALALALVVAVRWQTQHVPRIVEAELWTPSPVEPAPPVAEAPAPTLPPPVAATPAPPVDIVVRRRPEPPPKPVRDAVRGPSFEDLLASESRQLDRRKAEAEQRRQAEVEARALADARAEAEAIRRSAARAQALADYTGRIKGKIRGNLVLPANLKGNPVARFVVTQLPSGEIIEVRMRQSSGNRAYDEAVERAIHKSAPLPKPDDGSVFSRDLVLTFCPDEERGCR